MPLLKFRDDLKAVPLSAESLLLLQERLFSGIQASNTNTTTQQDDFGLGLVASTDVFFKRGQHKVQACFKRLRSVD